MRQLYSVGLILLSLNAVLFCAASAADNSSASLLGAGINDSGFRPDINGFSFQNYGEDPDTVDLTSSEMQRMFGDQVCAGKSNGQCILTYPAERWMNQAVSAMKSGHCEGLAVLSSLLYYNQTSSGAFGGNESIDLSLENVLLQREIGYWWTTQVTTPGGAKKVLDSPVAVLDTLTEAFNDKTAAKEWWVLGIYLPDGSGGHAITPFAVDNMENGTSRIFVYDNNWPKDVRYIEVDRAANTWSYLASTNPDEPGSLYTGNASTKNLEIVSLSSRLGQQRCDFCDKSAGNAGSNGTKVAVQGAQSIQIWQNGRARVLVTDESGRRVGVLESSEFVNEIPEAEVRSLKFGLDHPPLIWLPSDSINNSHLAIEVHSAANDSAKNLADTAVFASGFALDCSIPDLKQGLQQNMDLFSDGGAYNVSISANSQLSPTISVDTDLQRVSLSGLNLDPSGMINISMNPKQAAFSMSTIGNIKPGTLQLMMSSLDPASGTSSTFKSLDMILRADDGVSMDLAGSIGGVSSPTLSLTRKNGVASEMSMISVSKDVPVSMPEIPDVKNMTSSNMSSNLSGSKVLSSSSSVKMPDSAGVSGSSSMPSASGMSGTTAMPSIGTPQIP